MIPKKTDKLVEDLKKSLSKKKLNEAYGFSLIDPSKKSELDAAKKAHSSGEGANWDSFNKIKEIETQMTISSLQKRFPGCKITQTDDTYKIQGRNFSLEIVDQMASCYVRMTTWLKDIKTPDTSEKLVDALAVFVKDFKQ